MSDGHFFKILSPSRIFNNLINLKVSVDQQTHYLIAQRFQLTLLLILAEIRKLFKVLIQNVGHSFFEHILPSSTDLNLSQSMHLRNSHMVLSQLNETYLINSTDKSCYPMKNKCPSNTKTTSQSLITKTISQLRKVWWRLQGDLWKLERSN